MFYGCNVVHDLRDLTFRAQVKALVMVVNIVVADALTLIWRMGICNYNLQLLIGNRLLLACIHRYEKKKKHQ